MPEHSSNGLRTWQDFQRAQARGVGRQFILGAIDAHVHGPLCQTALDADTYDRQRNRTISEYVQTIFRLTGQEVEDYTASNAKIASNFFNRLNTQRLNYSLGRGISFAGGEDGTDDTMQRLGAGFQQSLREWAYAALIHGVAFGFWDLDRLYVFEVTEFVPLWDELTGALRGGIRFWRLDADRPMSVTLYEEDGITGYMAFDDEGGGQTLKLAEPKRAYRQTVASYADGTQVIAGEDNWDGALPIIPLWGSRLHQSTLVGMRQAIDSYDLIQSGFANDLTDVSQVYWIVENCGGMSDEDLARWRDRLKLMHIATADTDDGGKVTPYTQEIPYQARQAYLDGIEHRIYRDFGGLDVTELSSSSKTATEIEAAYQPLDEEASDFEYQVRKAIMRLLALLGIDDEPVFHRQRITNQLEQVQMVAQEAQWLDRETILQKLPNISPDEIAGILARSDDDDAERFGVSGAEA
ncbi:MAG: phage portal protein [Atopobiaceae bacterium]|nr:phage portal protein [Atopobiaceae bacterium]